MDLTILSQNIVSFLTPFLPYLIKASEKAVEEAGKKFGMDAWERAKTLWSKLRPKVDFVNAVEEAAQSIANIPGNEAAKSDLCEQLKKLLANDKTLAIEIANIVRKNPEIYEKNIIKQRARDNSIQIGQAGDVRIQK